MSGHHPVTYALHSHSLPRKTKLNRNQGSSVKVSDKKEVATPKDGTTGGIVKSAVLLECASHITHT